jgi:hypothetical protein
VVTDRGSHGLIVSLSSQEKWRLLPAFLKVIVCYLIIIGYFS